MNEQQDGEANLRTGRKHEPAIVYAINMACAGYATTLLWAYATHKNRLVDKNFDSAQARRGIIIHLTSPVVFTLSIGIAMIDSTAAQYSWLFIIVLHMIARRVFHLPSNDELD